MTEEIIDVTKCEFNTFDGGGSQRTICSLDGCFCDGIRPKECYFKQFQRLKQENERLREKIIKLTEENGNLIINRNTAENKLQDAENRLKSIQKANTHNLVLLQRHNNVPDEIREIIETRFKPETEYFSLSFKEYDEIIEDIDKIVSEVENE